MSAAPAVDAPRRPAARSGITYHEPAGDHQPWVVEVPGVGYKRMGSDVVRLVRAADGRRDLAELTAALGPPWNRDLVTATVADLAARGVVVDPDAEAGTTVPTAPGWSRGRVRFKPPFSLQLEVVHPEAFFTRHARSCRALTGRVAAAAAIAIAITGLIGMAARAGELGAVLSEPQPLGVLAGMLAGFVALTSLHEVAHGAALAGQGGRVRRMGVMLFYLSPAFFTDVSDAWRLPTPAGRVRVALAGGVASAAMAGAMGVVLGVAGTGIAGGTLLAYLAVTTYIGAVFNLIPLVKFDGYVALMTHLDIPHLRDKALHDWRHAVVGGIAGRAAARGRRRLADVPWAVPFGIGCALMPVALVGGLAIELSGALAGLGRTGAVMRLAITAALVLGALKLARRMPAHVDVRGVRPVRLAAGIVVAAALSVAIGSVRIDATVTGGWVDTGSGTLLVLHDDSDAQRLGAGGSVSLVRRGLFGSRQVGTATVPAAPISPRDTTVPAAALAPGFDVGGELVAPAVGLADVRRAGDDRSVGVAHVDAGTTTVALWLVEKLLLEPVRGLR